MIIIDNAVYFVHFMHKTYTMFVIGLSVAFCLLYSIWLITIQL